MTKRSSVPTVSICAVGLLVLVALVGFGTLPEYIRELGIARQLAKSGLRVSFRRGAAYRVNLTFDPGVRNGILRMTDSEDSAPRQFSELEDTRITLLPASTIDQLVELRRLEILMLGWSNLSDRDIKSISQLRTIQQLHVYCTYITDDGIRYLRDLPMLEDINLAGTSVGDRGVDYLPEEQLKKINLVDTQVSGAVLAKLANCHKLEFLWLPRIELTHADLQNLASMKNLKDLRIQCPGLGDEDMAYLGGLKRIRKLRLSETDITDNSVDELEQFELLEFLDVSYTQMTVEGVKRLSKMRHLKELSALGLNIPRAVVQEILDERPDLQFSTW